MSTNLPVCTSRSDSISRRMAAASSSGSRLAFHFSPGAPAQTTRSYLPGRSAPSVFSSKCACASWFLPMKPSGPMSAVGIPAAQYSPSMQGTVLGVDDEQANLDSLERIFAREGWRFLRAGTGPAALELLRAEPVDVVLTDLMMPGMSGQELLRAVRAVAPDAEVVLMTAYGTVDAAVAAMKDGAYAFLTKPLNRPAGLQSVTQAPEKPPLALWDKRARAQQAD